MKSFGEILKELGFNENAPESVQKAFFQHLAQQSLITQKPNPPANSPAPQQKSEQQLSLDLDSTDAIVCTYNNKKVS